MTCTNLSNINLSKTDISGSNFIFANITGAVLPQNLSKCNFTAFKFAGDLSSRNFSNAILVQANFEEANISSCNFSGAKITGCSFPVRLSNVTFKGAILDSVNFSKCTLKKCNFSGCKLGNTTLPTSLAGCNFSNTKLVGKDLSKMNLTGAIFTKATIEKVIFPDELKNINFSDARLEKQDFSKKSFANCNFSGATITESNFSYSKFIECDLPKSVNKCDFSGLNVYKWSQSRNHSLEKMDLRGCVFSGCNLRLVRLPVDMSECNFSNSNWKNVSFSTIKVNKSIFSKCRLQAKQLPRDLTGCNFENSIFEGDFAGYDFSQSNLSGADFSSSTVSGAKFDRAVISKTTVFPNDLHNCSFNGVDWAARDLSKFKITGASFVGAKLMQVTLPADLTDCNFSKLGVFSRNLSSSEITGAKFSQTNLKGTTFPKSLKQCDFSGAQCLAIDFLNHDIEECNFGNMTITNKKFPALRGCSFSGASLDGVTFAEITNIDFSDAKFVQVAFPKEILQCTFYGNDLTRISGVIFTQCKLSKVALPTILNCSIFNGCELSSVDLSKSNLAASAFKSCTFNSTTLPAEIVKFENIKFVNCDLRPCSKSFANFSSCSFEKCNFSGLELCFTSSNEFNDCDLSECTFPQDLSNISLTNCDLSSTDLSDSDLSGHCLSCCNLYGCILPTNLQNVDLSGCDLKGEDLSGRDLSTCNITGCNLSGCNLSKCNLPHDLQKIDFSACDLSQLSLSSYNFSECDISALDFTTLNLKGSNLSGCHLPKGCDVSKFNLSGCNIAGSTLTEWDFSTCASSSWQDELTLSGCDLSSCTFSKSVNLFEGGSILSTQQKKVLHGWLPGKCWELIYKATRDGDSAKNFHDRCDNQGPTVVVIKANGYIFGGYANSSWTSSESNLKDAKTFLFTLTNAHNVAPTKLHCKAKGNAQYNSASKGPAFGQSELDLCSEFLSKSTSVSFPSSFSDTTNVGQYLFANSDSFVCSEVEVFKMKKESMKKELNFNAGDLSEVIFRDCKLPKYLVDCDFGCEQSQLTGCDLSECDLSGCSLFSFTGGTIMTQDNKKTLERWLPEKRRWELLYQASKDGQTAQNFHQNCDNKGPLVIVIKSTCGRTFGAYAHASWQSNSSGSQNSESFLFVFNGYGCTNHKFPSTKNQSYYTQYFHPSYGPFFGNGYNELMVANNCLSQSSSHAVGGNHFTNTTGQSYPFTGNSSFVCQEMEVYCHN